VSGIYKIWFNDQRGVSVSINESEFPNIHLTTKWLIVPTYFYFAWKRNKMGYRKHWDAGQGWGGSSNQLA